MWCLLVNVIGNFEFCYSDFTMGSYRWLYCGNDIVLTSNWAGTFKVNLILTGTDLWNYFNISEHTELYLVVSQVYRLSWYNLFILLPHTFHSSWNNTGRVYKSPWFFKFELSLNTWDIYLIHVKHKNLIEWRNIHEILMK